MKNALRDGIRARLREISVQYEAVERERVRLQEVREALERVLELDPVDPADNSGSVDPAGRSVNQNLIELARQNNGILETREAIAVFVEAGIYRSREEANDGIHTTLRRSKDFERIDRGLYQYVDRARRVQGLGLADLVEQYLRHDYSLSNEEILDMALRQGFDFGDKNPVPAVHMAVIHARRRIQESRQQLGGIGFRAAGDEMTSTLNEMPSAFREIEDIDL